MFIATVCQNGRLGSQPNPSHARSPVHLSLQTPPGGIFDQNDLQWTERSITVGPNKGDTLKEAYIPVSRVQDFVAGELLRLQQAIITCNTASNA